MLIMMLSSVKLCLGKPVNRSTNEEEHIINKDPAIMEGSLKESGTLSSKTDRVKEEEQPKASWETAR